MKKEQMINFINKKTDEILCAISVKGLFTGEIQATKELLAENNMLKIQDIKAIGGFK